MTVSSAYARRVLSKHSAALAECVSRLSTNGQPSGTAVDTSTVGSHTLRVTATSNDGPTGAASVTYVVAAPPSARISSPAGVARYVKGQVVDASYGRVEGAGGPGISSCTGTVAAGDPIDTSSVGQHAFTVTARLKDG